VRLSDNWHQEIRFQARHCRHAHKRPACAQVTNGCRLSTRGLLNQLRQSLGAWTLEMLFAGIRETDGPWYVTEYRVVDGHSNVVLDLGRTDWADWSRGGDLLFAKEGCLFRARMNKRTGPALPEKLIDLRSLEFEAVVPAPEATRWGGQPVAGKLLPHS